MKCKGRKKKFNTKNADNGNNSNLTLAKFNTNQIQKDFEPKELILKGKQ